MIKRLAQIYRHQSFRPSFVIGILINPYYLIRRNLVDAFNSRRSLFQSGTLVDIGCGASPYRDLFSPDFYCGLDVKISGHDHTHSNIDLFYDGFNLPLRDTSIDGAFASEVFEHVFDLDGLLTEIHRILKPGGFLLFSVPFAWSEHEEPFDFARYTSFGISHVLERNQLEVISIEKTGNAVIAITQLISDYIFTSILPKNRPARAILALIFCSPINIIGVMLGLVLPKSTKLYMNLIVVAQKNSISNE